MGNKIMRCEVNSLSVSGMLLNKAEFFGSSEDMVWGQMIDYIRGELLRSEVLEVKTKFNDGTQGTFIKQ
jgi:hypothetical protein